MFRYSKKSMFDRVENGRPRGPNIGGLMSKWAFENLNSFSKSEGDNWGNAC